MPVIVVNGCPLANHWTGLDNDWIAGVTFELIICSYLMNSMAIVKHVPMYEAYVSVLYIQSLNDIPRAGCFNH